MTKTLPDDPAQTELKINENELAKSNRRIQKYIDASMAENTRRAYRADLKDFGRWCNEKGRQALPAHPHTVADYLATLAESGDYKASTLERRSVAIRRVHEEAGHKNPFEDYGQASEQLDRFVKGVKRELGMESDKKTPAVARRIRRMILSMDETEEVRCARDRAVLLVGLLGALRRSELVGLDVEDVEFQERGVRLYIAESQTDQAGEGAWVGIWRQPVDEMCAVQALEKWLEVGRITDGPIFRGIDRWQNIKEKRLSAYSVALIVKRAAKEAGFDPDKFGAHSLRSGLLVDRANEHDEQTLAEHSRHSTREGVREYVERSGAFRNNVTREMFRMDGFWRAYKWFLSQYRRPHGVVERGEDGWQWRDGEPYRAREVLEIRYGDKMAPDVIEEVAEFLEDLSTVWVKREQSSE